MEPAKQFPRPREGTLLHRGKQIEVSKSGIVVDGRHDDRAIEFVVTQGGIGCEVKCVALLTDSQVKIFEGSTVGRGFIDRNLVLAGA